MKKTFHRLMITAPKPFSVAWSPRLGHYVAGPKTLALDGRIIDILDSQGEKVGTARRPTVEGGFLIGRTEGSSEAAETAEILVHDRVLNSVYFELDGTPSYLSRDELFHLWAESSIEPSDSELKVVNAQRALPLMVNASVTAIHLSVSVPGATKFSLLSLPMDENTTPTQADLRAEATFEVARTYHAKQALKRAMKG